MICNLNSLNDSQFIKKEIGPNDMINAKALRDQLMLYTSDRRAIQATRIKKSKANASKASTNKDVERLIARLQQDEQKAL
jgi:hypothetical protein